MTCITCPTFYAVLFAASLAATATLAMVSNDLSYPAQNRHATPQMVLDNPELF